MGERWRIGRSVGRTLYAHEECDAEGRLIGLMDTPELAAEAARAVNKLRNVADGFERWPWPEPTRFDPDDRSTWPEEGNVLLWTGEWETAWFTPEPRWQMQGTYDVHERRAGSGDLWLPLPPTPEVQG